MRVTVDPARCQGHGRCYELSPEVFGADEQGTATVIDGPSTPRRLAAALIGSDNCPERAIIVDDSAPEA